MLVHEVDDEIASDRKRKHHGYHTPAVGISFEREVRRDRFVLDMMEGRKSNNYVRDE